MTEGCLMDQLITVLERHKNLIKVKCRGEFGYFFPTTNLVNKEAKVESFVDAENLLKEFLNRQNDELIMVPRFFDFEQNIFTIQGVSKTDIQKGLDGDLGTFYIDPDGNIKKQA